MIARSYPNPCENCKKADTCNKGYGCTAWRTRYRYRQKQINAYAKQKKNAYFATRFVYQHPNDTKRYLSQWPCEHCENEKDCDVPCTQYLNWYNTRMMLARKKVGICD